MPDGLSLKERRLGSQMKSSSSATQTGLYVLGGVVGVYVLGFALLVLDLQFTQRVFDLPEPIRDSIFKVYAPIGFRVITTATPAP